MKFKYKTHVKKTTTTLQYNAYSYCTCIVRFSQLL